MSADFLDFSPRLKAILESNRTVNSKGESIPIAGTSTLNNIKIIRESLLYHRPINTLEIGLAYGASALTFLATLKDISPGNFHHAAIDPFQSSAWQGSAIQVIKEEGFTDHFRFYEGFSSTVLPKLVESGDSFGLIYIDGSHLFEDVFLDFIFSAQLLEMGGVVLFDDCTDPHVAKVIRFARKNYAGILKPLDLRRFENSKIGITKRIANALGYRQLKGFQKVGSPPRRWDSPFHRF